MPMNRRQMLKGSLASLAYLSLDTTAPTWIVHAVQSAPPACFEKDRILVILQHGGGIDGLNTVIPISDPLYYAPGLRPTLQIGASDTIRLDALNGLHPRLPRLADWYQRGKLAILQNVGYVNPNLSHFSSTDFFEFGSVPGEPLPSTGWVARLHDSLCPGAGDAEALRIVAAGHTRLPDALSGSDIYAPPSIYRANDFTLNAFTDPVERFAAIRALNTMLAADPEIDFLQRSYNVTEAATGEIAKAAALPDLVPAGSYPGNKLGRDMRLISQVIRSGADTKIFYVSQGGYDSHANQIDPGDPLNQGSHPRLIATFDQALGAFLDEMELSGNLHRVLVMTFSEFGRRAAENGSFGTDHGAANCSFVVGGSVNGGVYGGQPDLGNLIKGNLRHSLDFRSVYSKVMEGWFEAPAAAVFGSATYDLIIAPELPRLDFIGEVVAPTPTPTPIPTPTPVQAGVPASIWRKYGGR